MTNYGKFIQYPGGQDQSCDKPTVVFVHAANWRRRVGVKGDAQRCIGQIVCKLLAQRRIKFRSSIENEKFSPGPERIAARGRHTQAGNPRKEEKRKKEFLLKMESTVRSKPGGDRGGGGWYNFESIMAPFKCLPNYLHRYLRSMHDSRLFVLARQAALPVA